MVFLGLHGGSGEDGTLQSLLDLATPAYRHHRLLTNDKGKRLAKRDGAMTLAALRQAGHAPAEVRAMAGFVG